MRNSNSVLAQSVLGILLVIGSFFFGRNCASGVYNNKESARLAYEKVPVTSKVMVKELIARIAAAKSGDFIALKNGNVLRVKYAAKNYSGIIEVRVESSSRVSNHFLLYEWMVWRDINRLVKQTDPDAGAAALKFLSQ